MWNRIANRIKGMFARGQVLSVDDSKAMQVIKSPGLEGEVLDKMQRIQQYGLAAYPPKGSAAFIVFMGGDRSSPVVIAVDDTTGRPKDLSEGEAVLFNSIKSTFFKLNDGGKAELNCDLEVDGNVSDSVDTLAELRGRVEQLETNHTHASFGGPPIPLPPTP